MPGKTLIFGLLVVATVVLTIFVFRYVSRNKQVDAVMRIVEADSSGISPHARQLISDTFARSLPAPGEATNQKEQ